MHYTKQDFGEDFKWGVSTAAYQVEGGYNLDGKGKSVWDVFSNTKGKTFLGQNGNTACDFYHRYSQDIALIPRENELYGIFRIAFIKGPACKDSSITAPRFRDAQNTL